MFFTVVINRKNTGGSLVVVTLDKSTYHSGLQSVFQKQRVGLNLPWTPSLTLTYWASAMFNFSLRICHSALEQIMFSCLPLLKVLRGSNQV